MSRNPSGITRTSTIGGKHRANWTNHRCMHPSGWNWFYSGWWGSSFYEIGVTLQQIFKLKIKFLICQTWSCDFRNSYEISENEIFRIFIILNDQQSDTLRWTMKNEHELEMEAMEDHVKRAAVFGGNFHEIIENMKKTVEWMETHPLRSKRILEINPLEEETDRDEVNIMCQQFGTIMRTPKRSPLIKKPRSLLQELAHNHSNWRMDHFFEHCTYIVNTQWKFDHTSPAVINTTHLDKV